jgi:HlyD family secretion protein
MEEKDKEKELPEADAIELRSEELQEVLGGVPPWILRWGITLLGGVAVLLLVGSMVFRYPDVITAQATLTGAFPPAAIVAHATGRIDTLCVRDRQQVSAGDFLAVIDNPASTEDVMRLKAYITAFGLPDGHATNREDTGSEAADSHTALPPDHLRVGALQSLYLSFYSALLAYNDFIALAYHPGKRAFLGDRLRGYEAQYRDLERQHALVREQLDISESRFGRDSVLMQRGVLSVEEFEGSRSQVLQSRLALESSSASLGALKLQIAQTREALFENSHEHTERRNTLRSELSSLSARLAGEIRAWEMSYILQSPVAGRVTFTRYWTRNQNITAGEEVFSVVPGDSASLLVKAQIPAAGSGKVREGQRVNIRFDNFPENEFGLVEGVVKSVSLVPVVHPDNSVVYTADISLPGGITTSYGKDLPYLPNMTGRADIITEELSLFARFLMPLRKLWTKNIQ